MPTVPHTSFQPYSKVAMTRRVSALEAFRHFPTDGSFAVSVGRLATCTKCPNLRFLSYWAGLLSQLQVISRVKLTQFFSGWLIGLSVGLLTVAQTLGKALAGFPGQIYEMGVPSSCIETQGPIEIRLRAVWWRKGEIYVSGQTAAIFVKGNV